MNQINVFLANNYIWFIIADVFVFFALIGYLKDPKNKFKPKKLETIKFHDINEDSIEELKLDSGNDKEVEKL